MKAFVYKNIMQHNINDWNPVIPGILKTKEIQRNPEAPPIKNDKEVLLAPYPLTDFLERDQF